MLQPFGHDFMVKEVQVHFSMVFSYIMKFHLLQYKEVAMGNAVKYFIKEVKEDWADHSIYPGLNWLCQVFMTDSKAEVVDPGRNPHWESEWDALSSIWSVNKHGIYMYVFLQKLAHGCSCRGCQWYYHFWTWLHFQPEHREATSLDGYWRSNAMSNRLSIQGAMGG